MKKVTIIVDDKKIHLALGGILTEWKEQFEDYGCWDFLFEELIDGTIEPNENIWYWYIDGRCYETNEEVMDE